LTDSFGADACPELSNELLWQILDGVISDGALCRLVWQRLGYGPVDPAKLEGPWQAGITTPANWAEAYPLAPPFIEERPASVMLTRSIASEYKQLLKAELGFKGYPIGELVPRLTRRATAVSWLLAWRRIRAES
jgi:hypothetical protein